jgi:drug/metabolite transporter (DMT)-like permease
VIACSSPVFVFLLGFVFLKESCGVIPVITILMAVLGVGIITRPPLLTGEESFKTNDLVCKSHAFLISLKSAI